MPPDPRLLASIHHYQSPSEPGRRWVRHCSPQIRSPAQLWSQPGLFHVQHWPRKTSYRAHPRPRQGWRRRVWRVLDASRSHSPAWSFPERVTLWNLETVALTWAALDSCGCPRSHKAAYKEEKWDFPEEKRRKMTQTGVLPHGDCFTVLDTAHLMNAGDRPSV